MAAHIIMTCDRCGRQVKRDAAKGAAIPGDWGLVQYDSACKSVGAIDQVEVCGPCITDWHRWRRGEPVASPFPQAVTPAAGEPA
jgi:hypothetical protein